MTKPLYTAQAQVTGGRTQGRGRTSDGVLEVDLRQPKEMGGDGSGTNPEQLFAIGYAACFSTVLSMLGQRKGLDAGDAVVDSKVSLIPSGNGTFKLGVELDITLPSIGDTAQASDLVRNAHQVCPYSNATRGNIDVALVVNGAEL
ncbi:organic hydroperoxide resistance protein [Nonomuraea sp. NPDC000554]|uniref:organic hydroperoxide resistance protein n=1 Tax=Nonomuraea sp. NPDC000554 TaxID=3154259 RepID=UPI003322845A